MTPPIRMVSVPVEPTKAMLAAAATSDWLYKDDVASTIWSAMLTAAPAREEGGAVIRKALQAELDWHDRVADFACDEARECSARGEKADEATAMRRMNAHNERASLIRTALATREEAPAEAGELAEAVERLTSAADFLEGDCVIVGDHEVRGNDLLTVLSALRAQPQAREEAQPVACGRQTYRARKAGCTWFVERELPCINGLSAWFTICTVHEADEREIGYTDGGCGDAEKNAQMIARCLTTPPAPEAEKLRDVLVEALEPFALLAPGEGKSPVNMSDPLSKWLTIAQLVDAAEALAALQQEGRP